MSALRLTLRFVCALALLVCPLLGRAETLQLLSTSGGSSGGVEIYPYNFSVNGSSATIALACLNFDREVTVGEQWQVSVHGLDMGMSQEAVNYRADAVLYYAFGKYGFSNSDVQYAIWSIFDPAVRNNSSFTATSQWLATTSLQYASDAQIINSGFFQNFLLYTPTTNQTGWTAGMPQEFIGTAVTPEPASLLLLGTGLLASALIWSRQRSLLSIYSC